MPMQAGRATTDLNREMPPPTISVVDGLTNNNGVRTLAQDFSATLDEMFRLNGVSALEDSLVQK